MRFRRLLAHLGCWVRLGHSYPPTVGWRSFERGKPALCQACGAVLQRPCDNCGETHDLRGVLVFSCTVTRRGWE